MEKINLKFMAENEQAKVCPKCGQQMKEGHLRSLKYRVQWAAKQREKGLIARITDEREEHEIYTYRCTGCGYLESYAP